MKCLLIYFFFFLVIITQINLLKQSKIKIEFRGRELFSPADNKSLVRCKICQDLNQFDFNYELIFKDKKKISELQKIIEKLNTKTKSHNQENYSLENLEILAKEISMEFFFKGEESIFSTEEKNDKNYINEYNYCKSIPVGIEEKCDIKKLKVCETILNIKDNICVKNYQALTLINENKNKKIENFDEINQLRKSSQILKANTSIDILKKLENSGQNNQIEYKSEVSDVTNKETKQDYKVFENLNKILKQDQINKKIEINLKKKPDSFDFEKLMEEAKKQETIKEFLLKNDIYKLNHGDFNSNIFGIDKNGLNEMEILTKKNNIQENFFNFKQKRNEDFDFSKDFSPAESSSYIELTPEYIKNNFDSKPKKIWTPPKPVLLENFENNIGSQLKEISSLASEIARNEKRLKVMKQQLANKIEQFQSSYNVIQKTISEISKLVKIPTFPSLIKSPSSFTEDDWDETAKPKFLNR